MAVTRRTTTQAPPPPPAMAEGVNFLDFGFYSGGFTLPPGKYVWTDISIRMYKPEKSTNPTPPRLGALITMVPLADPKEANKHLQFYSFGTQADKSYQPNATGKGILPIPGAPASGLNNQTNWAILLKSLLDSGLPPGLATNDVSVLEGIWVDMTLIDEPLERASFVSNTAEEAGQERKANKIAVVREVLAGPWDAGNPGGWPDQPVTFAEDTAGVAVQAPRTNGAPSPVLVNRTLAPPPASVPTVNVISKGADETVLQAAINGVATVLDGTNSMSRLQLKNHTFSAVKTSQGEQMAAAVIASLFDDPQGLNTLLANVGYKVSGLQVVPAA